MTHLLWATAASARTVPSASNPTKVGALRPAHTTTAKPDVDTGRTMPRHSKAATSAPARSVAAHTGRLVAPYGNNSGARFAGGQAVECLFILNNDPTTVEHGRFL
jgi:hypothetical protein